MCGLRTLLSKSNIAIVDTAMIELVKSAVFDCKDSSLRRHGNIRHAHQILMGVDERWRGDGKVVNVLLNHCERIARVGKDPPEGDALRGQFPIQPCDFGDIAIGDRTVGGGKNKDNKVDVGTG